MPPTSWSASSRKWGADLVVLGYKGHSRIAQFVIGTTAQKVDAYSAASVLIVKPRGGIGKLWPRAGEREQR